MLQLASKPSRVPSTHGDEFLRRYGLLFSRCLRLTRHKDRAQDLLHDAFVQFSINRPDLELIHDLDGYLCRLVRNLYIAQMRLASRSPRNNLPLPDYDTAEIALRSRDLCSQMYAQQELLRICRYAFLRREVSREASVLILRYFHGYYPSEAAQVINGNRRLVDQLLAVARKEVKGYLAEASQTKAAPIELPTELAKVTACTSTAEFLTALRRALLLPKNGHCVPTTELKAVYQDSRSVRCSVLAHIVHCAYCLDEINRLRGLAPLSERHAVDTVEREKPPRRPGANDGPPPGASVSTDTSRQLTARTRETFEHRPVKLHVCVNGYDLGGQRIGAAVNELSLTVNLLEAIAFVEVYSEQGIRLFFMEIEPIPGGAVEQLQCVNLSDGRTLEAIVSFAGASPNVKVTYYDPIFEEQLQDVVETVVFRPVLVPRFAPNTEETSSHAICSVGVAAWLGMTLRGVASQVRSILGHNGYLATAGVILTLAAVLGIHQFHTGHLSAGKLLSRSVQSEQGVAQDPGWVQHRTLGLQELDYPSGTLLSHLTVEIWQSAASQVRLQRLFDENNQLIAEEQVSADSSVKVYEPSGENHRKGGVSLSVQLLLDKENAWMLDLSPKSFSSLVDENSMTVAQEPESYVISYDPRHSVGPWPSLSLLVSLGPELAIYRKLSGVQVAPVLLKGTITLQKQNLHAVGEKLVIQHGSVIHEFRLAEEKFQRLPTSTVDPTVFEPTLLNSALGASQPHRIAGMSDTTNQQKELVRLEVEALYRLNHIGPELENQVGIRRTGRRLTIQGTVDSRERKEEILSALSPILRYPAVRVEVQTVAEALEAQSTNHPEPIVAREVEVTDNSIAVASELSHYFTQEWRQRLHAGDESAEQEWIQRRIRELSAAVLEQSHRSYLHALALHNLVDDLSGKDTESLDATHRAQWEALIKSHADAVRIETRAIRKELAPIFFPAQFEETSGLDETLGNDSDSQLERAIGCLFEMTSKSDEAILTDFTVSGKKAADAIDEARRLRYSLLKLEALAAQVSSYGSSSPQ
jgi:DNA-directed RNA polymerase specialized sigma24 family protein